MKIFKYLLILSLALVLSSCYHARISTDQEPSVKVVEKPWHHGFLFGLVYPNEIDVSDKCTNGVAEVDTKLSFLNMLVSNITFGIYTPMNIEVRCAATSQTASSLNIEDETSMSVLQNSSEQEIINTIHKAAVKSKELDTPVYIKFE
ncbi:Bor/Iss family lipoprotein [Fodinibius sp. N2]|uniref:Bor/Iss family lipoprotein n=1 Tax=Fodinibius alkaliphilus TaxID=3140241 RepID=UPI00315A7563